jgi:endo-1,4-beta-mannosidase
MRTIRFGLNYVPSRRWYYCWNDWNASEIAEDFDAIAALGVDHLRVQLIWSYFQPNPTYVSPLHLQRLEQLMELAAERGLDIQVSVLTGFLSGYRFLPSDIKPGDIFFKEDVFWQSTRLFEAVLNAIGQRSNFLGFDLGNEINAMIPELTMADGDAWGRKMIDFLRPKMSGKWVVNGVDHNPWFNGGTFSTRHLAADYDAVCLHGWPLFTGCLLHGKLADARSIHLSAFMTYMARYALPSDARNKPIWIQEFGCSSEWGDDHEKESFMRQSVPLAIEAGATWFTWWCSHDVDRRFRFSPLEYDLGLLTVENRPKLLAGVYRELIEEFSEVPLPTLIAPEKALPGIDADFAPKMLKKLPGEQWIEQNLESNTWPLFDRYLEACPDKA